MTDEEMKKRIDEMIGKFSKEEWAKFIDEEMEKLGLEFVPGTTFNLDDLFMEE